MAHPHSRYTASVSRRPIYSILMSFPVVCFTLTLLTDIAYWQTGELMWLHFSEWLLFAGLVFGAIAAVIGVIELLVRPQFRALGPTWLQAAGMVVVFILAIWNSLVHTADGWTAVVPYGLILSAVTIVVMIATALFGRPAIVDYHMEEKSHA